MKSFVYLLVLHRQSVALAAPRSLPSAVELVVKTTPEEKACAWSTVDGTFAKRMVATNAPTVVASASRTVEVDDAQWPSALKVHSLGAYVIRTEVANGVLLKVALMLLGAAAFASSMAKFSKQFISTPDRAKLDSNYSMHLDVWIELSKNRVG